MPLISRELVFGVYCVAVLALLAAIASGSAFGQVTANAAYSEAIGPLIEAKCVHCHRPGGIAPTSFMSYGEVRQWLKQSYTPVDALLRTRAMPPWPADPKVGAFLNAEFMTDGEIDLFIGWMKSGMPMGNGEYEGPAPRGEWIGRTPDHVFELPAYTVPQETIGEYKTFQVATDFSEDRWIAGSEIRPGNPYAVSGISGGVLGGHQPGQTTLRYPASYGTLLKKGATVDVRMHYFKEEGIDETDQSYIGVFFAKDDAPRRAILEAPMRADPFTIPAGKADFEVSTQFRFEEDGKIVSFMPVMHFRGKRVAYTLRLPDGTEQSLLVIPEWNPNWKYRYVLREPVSAPKGSVVRAVAVFDNSEENLKNPDPWSDVSMGPEGETFEGWLGYARVVPTAR
jgi:hypothetical protein